MKIFLSKRQILFFMYSILYRDIGGPSVKENFKPSSNLLSVQTGEDQQDKKHEKKKWELFQPLVIFQKIYLRRSFRETVLCNELQSRDTDQDESLYKQPLNDFYMFSISLPHLMLERTTFQDVFMYLYLFFLSHM